MDDKDILILTTFIARVNNQIARLRATNVILVTELAKLTGSNIKELVDDIEVKHAKMQLQEMDALNKIIREAQNPKSMTVEDLLKSLDDKP